MKRALDNVNRRMAQLARSGQRRSAFYTNLFSRQQQLAEMAALSSSQANVVQQADQVTQVQPKPSRNGILGLVLGTVSPTGRSSTRKVFAPAPVLGAQGLKSTRVGGTAMRGFWKREDKLERELRAQRPEPRAEFMQSIESRVNGKAYRRPTGSLRLGLAAALTVGMLVALASFGGLSYAATGVSHAVQAATHIVAPAHQAAPTVKSAPLSSAQAQYLVAMCFHRHTIYVDSHAARVLRALGATLGPCSGGRRTPPAVTTVICVKGTNVRVTLVNARALIKSHKATKGFCKKG